MTGEPAKPGCVVPSIKTGLVTVGNAEPVDRVRTRAGDVNVMLSTPVLALALRIACRSEPAPLSLVFVTTNDTRRRRLVSLFADC